MAVLAIFFIFHEKQPKFILLVITTYITLELDFRYLSRSSIIATQGKNVKGTSDLGILQ